MESGQGGSRRPDSAQLVRQWAILRLLSESGRSFSVKELADQLVSSKATIQRDLATLEQDFALIEEEAGKQKKLYRIDGSIRALQALTFGTLELLALHAAAATGAMQGTPFADDLRSVAQKLRGFLSPRHNGGLDAMARVFAPHRRTHVDYGAHGEIIDGLSDAISQRRVCTATYHAAWRDSVKEHTFRPLRLVWHRGALYLLCVLDGLTDITTLAVQRLEELTVTRDEFATPRIDVDAHLRKAFGIFVANAASGEETDVEIIFDKQIAWRIEEQQFHPDEQKERLDDGRLVYRIRSSAQWEIVPWVLSFGSLAVLEKPAHWREVIVDTVKAMTGMYE
ncbi:MAG TPA: transcriptional regulator [Kofleriaceae bacterium]|nr:transcriptional regulator [Kofleriaceae bacterium]